MENEPRFIIFDRLMKKKVQLTTDEVQWALLLAEKQKRKFINETVSNINGMAEVLSNDD